MSILIFVFITASRVFEDYCGIEPIRYPEEETETRPPPLLSDEVLMQLYDDNSAALGGQCSQFCLTLHTVTSVRTYSPSKEGGEYILVDGPTCRWTMLFICIISIRLKSNNNNNIP